MSDNGENAAARQTLTPTRRRTEVTQMSQRKPNALSPQASLRAVMAQFATGVTVLTAGSGEDCHGTTVNAFTSVSLDPPLVLCCVARAARMHQFILSAGCFAVSILRADQQSVARYFADWRRPSGRAQFEKVDWWKGFRTGAPLLTGALGWVECELVKAYDGGDHSIFVGEVLSSQRNEDVLAEPSGESDALLFYAGDFHTLPKAA